MSDGLRDHTSIWNAARACPNYQAEMIRDAIRLRNKEKHPNPVDLPQLWRNSLWATAAQRSTSAGTRLFLREWMQKWTGTEHESAARALADAYIAINCVRRRS